VAGKEFSSLRELFRRAEYRRFRAQHRNGRGAEFVGFDKQGRMLGWNDGNDDTTTFDADAEEWTNFTVYV
jgi:hypothetical protein